MSHRRSTASSILQVFSLNPLPYPVLLILLLVFLFLGSQWYSSYEEAVEATEESLNWVLMATPFVLIFAVRLLSSIENPERFFGFGGSPWERRRRSHHVPSEGGSPWGVAVLILVVLLMVQFQSTVLEALFG